MKLDQHAIYWKQTVAIFLWAKRCNINKIGPASKTLQTLVPAVDTVVMLKPKQEGWTKRWKEEIVWKKVLEFYEGIMIGSLVNIIKIVYRFITGLLSSTVFYWDEFCWEYFRVGHFWSTENAQFWILNQSPWGHTKVKLHSIFWGICLFIRKKILRWGLQKQKFSLTQVKTDW